MSLLVTSGRFATRYYRAGDTIVVQGDDETRAFFVKSGWGCVSRTLRSGERQLIEFPLSGDVLDFSATAAARQEEFSALTDMCIIEGPSSRMHALALSETAVATCISEAARRRRTILLERLADIAQRDAGVRIAHFLLELGAQLARTGTDARKGYQCPLTQQDLADALGLTPIHVNRMLREARTLGLYEFRRGNVEFLNYEAAVEFADFDTDFLASPDGQPSSVHGALAGVFIR